jgi:hypothetical protein
MIWLIIVTAGNIDASAEFMLHDPIAMRIARTVRPLQIINLAIGYGDQPYGSNGKQPAFYEPATGRTSKALGLSLSH